MAPGFTHQSGIRNTGSWGERLPLEGGGYEWAVKLEVWVEMQNTTHAVNDFSSPTARTTLSVALSIFLSHSSLFVSFRELPTLCNYLTCSLVYLPPLLDSKLQESRDLVSLVP